MAKADEEVYQNFITFLWYDFNERKEILKSILKATPYILATPVSSLHRLILSDECNQQRRAIKYSLKGNNYYTHQFSCKTTNHICCLHTSKVYWQFQLIKQHSVIAWHLGFFGFLLGCCLGFFFKDLHKC